MQSVNVLPTFVSQDADLKSKGSLASTVEGNSDADFSRLVDKHLSEKSDENTANATSDKTQPSTAKQDRSIAAEGKEEINDHLIDQDHRQENDPLSKASEKNQRDTGKSESGQNKTGKSEEDHANEIVLKASELDSDITVDTAALSESEQFMSLLYSSDKTLTEAKTKHAESNESTQKRQVDKAAHKLATSAELNVKLNNEINDDIANISEVVEENVDDEHLLKAFSKDELLASMQLKKSNTAAQQSSDQVIKDYQASLQSSQELHAKKYNGDVVDQNTKAIQSAALESGIGAEKSEKTKGNDLNNAQLTIDSMGKIKSLSDNESLVKTTPLMQGEESIALDSLEGLALQNDVDDSPSTRQEILGKNESVVNINGDISKNNISKSNGINLKTENSNAANIQPEVTSQVINNVETVALAEKHNVATQQKSASIGLSQLNTQSVQEGLVSTNESEQASLNHENEEYDFAESTLAAQDKIKTPMENLSGKVTDNVQTRTVAESLLQNIQANQLKQNNDAYNEHQSSEMLNHTVASDTVQIQKNNVQLHQETISIFKKDFADAVKDKVMVMINQKLQQFDITLDPPEFGNMQIRVNLQGEQAAVNFVVQNQQAKEAVEQNMHKLKEMLAEQGVDVGGANVEQQDQQSDNDENNTARNANNGSGLLGQSDEDNVKHVLSAKLFDSSATGIDYYA